MKAHLCGPARGALAAAALALFCSMAAAAQAAPDAALDPAGAAPGAALATLVPPAMVDAVLRRAPAYQAALLDVDAARAQQRQWNAGDPAWTATLAAARRREANALPERTGEWELGLQRNLRLPGKAPAYESAGRARLAQAHAGVQRAWREQQRQLLEALGGWLRAQESARLWEQQVDLLLQQRDTVGKRQRLGAAAVIEQHQAEAALAQARAQAEAASGRALAAHETLKRRFPGLEPLAAQALPAPQPLPGSDAQWLALLQAASSELAQAREEVAAAAAQNRLDEVEQRPDPNLALRVGRARSGGEQMLGFSLSLPFGGDARAAVAQASAARAAAALRLQEDSQRQAEAQALQQLRAAQSAHTLWRAQADAAQRLHNAADGVARAYQLGEGSLADVLAARRLANEQGMEAALGAIDAWLLRSRLEVEAGLLWTPAVPPAAAAATTVTTVTAKEYR